MLLAIIIGLSLLASIPYLTKRYALKKVDDSLKITLRQFQDIASSYTDHGTPEELQMMIEGLEEVMEELKFLDKVR